MFKKTKNNVRPKQGHHCLSVVKSTIMACTVISTCLHGSIVYSNEGIASKVELYRVQLAVDTDNIELRKKYMLSLSEAQQYDQALSQLALLRMQLPDDDSLHADGAFIAFKKGDYSLANRYAEDFLKNNPDDDIAQIINGRIKYQLQDYKGAITAFNQSLTKRPFTDTYIYKANTFVAQGNIEEAINTYKEGLQTLGTLPLFLEKIIDLKKQQADYQGALDTLNQLIDSMGPNSRTEHYLLHKGELLEALNETQKAQIVYQQSYQQLNSRSDSLLNTPHSQELAKVLSTKLKQGVR